MEIAKNSNLPACLFHFQQKLSEGITLDQDYVPVRGMWNATKSNTDFDLDEHMDKFIVNEQKVLLLLGDSGAGKTLFCQQSQQRLLQYYLTDPTRHPLPLFISLPSSKDPVHQVVESALLGFGCSLEEINQLKQLQQFIFILDGYDEIRQNKNLYITNNLKEWQAKVIITCRSQYLLTLDYHSPYFMPYEGQKPQGWLLSEVVVKPFNQKQIDAYLQQYVNHHTTEWSDWKKYQQTIEEMPGLKALIQTPFLLKLAVDAMPGIVALYEKETDQLQYKNFTQAKLYDVFVEQWFTRQEEKLKANGQLKKDETITPKLWAYAQGLAKAMHQTHVTQITYEGDQDLFAEAKSTNPWEQFFAEDNETQLIRNASLLKKVGEHQYAFFHASLIDYFVSTEIHYQAQLISDTNQQIVTAKLAQIDTPKEKSQQDNPQEKNINEIKVCDEQGTSKFDNYFTSTNLPSHYYYFNQHILTKERGMLQFFADRVQEDANFKQDLFKIVEGSKYDEAMCIAAANAITVLNKANISFGMQDFAGIRIAQADLSYSNCDHTNFKGADLTGVNFTQAWLRKANLSYTQMAEVEFGQLPAIQHEYRVTAVAYSPNGKSIVTVDKNKLIVWDMQTQDKLYELNTGKEWIYSVAFSPNGEMIAAGGEGKEAVVWDLKFQEVKRLALEGAINSLVFSSDNNRVLAGGEEGKLISWNFIDNIFEVISHYPAAINTIAYSQNGNFIAAGCRNDKIYLYDLKIQKAKELLGHKTAINCLAFSPHNQSLASGSIDGEIRIWSLASEDFQVFYWHHELPVLTLTYSPDSTRLASAGNTEAICIYNLYTHAIQFFPGHNSNINALAYAPDGQFIISGSDDATVRAWQLAGNTLSAFEKRHNQYIGKLCFSNAGGLLALTNSYEKTIQVHTLATGKIQILSDDELFDPISFTSDSNHILSVSKRKLLQWDLITSQSKCLDEHLNRFILSIAVSKNGQWIASGSEQVRLLELNTGKVISLAHNYQESIMIDAKHKNNLNEAIFALSFSPDSLYLASASKDGFIRLWNLKSYQPILLKGHTDTIRALEYSPNGQWLASLADDHILRLWNLTNQQIYIISWTNVLGKISFSSDSKYILASSRKGYIGVFEVETGRCRGQLQGLQETLTDIKFVPHSHYEFVTGNFTGRLNHWRLISVDNTYTTFDWQLLKSNQPMIFETAEVEQDQIIGLPKLRCKLLTRIVTVYDPKQDAFYLSEIGGGKAFFGRCQEAIEDLKLAIELNPKKASNFYERGMCKRKLGFFEEAIFDYDKAIELNPKYSAAFNERGISKDDLNRYEEGIQDFDKAIEFDPKNPVLFYNRACAKRSLSRYEEAIVDCNRALEINPNYAMAFNNRGIAKDNLERYEEGIQDFNKAIKLDPNDASFFYNRAFAKRKLGHYEEAIVDCDRALEINPNYAMAFNNRGIAKDNLERYEEGIQDFNKAIKLDPNDASFFYNRAFAKRKLGHYEEAIVDCDRALEIDPNYAMAFNYRGTTKYELTHYEEAIKDYDKAIELNPDNATIFYNRGNSKDNLGRYEEAIKDYDKSIELNPNNADYFNNRGFVKGSLGRYEEANEDYDKAIALDANEADYFYNRASAKDSLGRYEESILDYDKVIELNSNDADYFNDRGFAKDSLGRYEEAIEDYNQAILLVFNDAYLYSKRGLTKVRLGYYQDALADSDKALALASNKNDKIIQGRFAVVWAYQGNQEKARQHLAEIKAEPEELYLKYYFNGWVEFLAHNYQAAITYFDKVLVEKVELPYYLAASLMLRGKVYLALGNLEQAHCDIEAALKLIPNHQEWQRWYQEVFGKQTISNIQNSVNEKISNHIENNQVNEKLISSNEKLLEIEKLGEYELIGPSNDIANNLSKTNLENNINETIQKINSNDLPTNQPKINTIISNLSEAAKYKKTDSTSSDIKFEDKIHHTIKNAFQFWQKQDEKNNDSKPVETLIKNIFLSSNNVMLKSASDLQATKLQAQEARQSNTLGCFKFWQEKEMAMENTKQPLFKKSNQQNCLNMILT